MQRLIDADALKKENERLLHCDFPYLSEITLEELIDEAPTIDAVPVSELKDTEKERDYWMDMAHSYEQTILRLTISASDTTAEPVRHGVWVARTLSEITGYDPALSGDDPVCSYSCSVCGEDCYVSDTGDDILSNYCPNCGARMDND